MLVVKAGRKLRWSRPIAVALTCGFHGGIIEELDPKRSCSETAELEVLFVDALPRPAKFHLETLSVTFPVGIG